MANEIEMYRGDTKTITVTVTANGSAYNLTGAALVMTVRKYDDGPVVFSNTMTIKDAAGGIAELTIPSATSAAFPVGSFVYDIELTTSDGKVYTIVKSTFTVTADVTKPA